MKQNRVISGAVAALVLAALLAGCGSTATGASSADSTPAATEAAGSEATAPTAEPQAEAALPDGVYTWFEPLPAFRNEYMPAISRLLLCIDTVKDPAKIAQASPFSKAQLLNRSESCAEKL